MKSCLIYGWNLIIFDHCSKRNDWSFEWFSESSFIRSLPIRQEILNVSQIGIEFHGICPPFFIQTWLQQYGRLWPSFTLRTALSAIPFVSDLCGVDCTLIPGKIFSDFAKFQGIVSVNDFRLPIRLQALLQAPLCFLRSLCFVRIRLDPLASQVLHHDCTSVIVSRFTIFSENFVICCDQITNIFWPRYDSAKTSSARGACDFGPLADLAISIFREVSFNTEFTQIRTSRRF